MTPLQEYSLFLPLIGCHYLYPAWVKANLHQLLVYRFESVIDEIMGTSTLCIRKHNFALTSKHSQGEQNCVG